MTLSTRHISTCLWFDDQAKEAAEFYTSLFPNSEMGETTKYTKEGQEFHQKQEGSDMTVTFEIEGQQFTALNGGPTFQLNPSISFFIACSEEEIDTLWTNLEKGGQVLMPLDKYDFSEKYGWVQDKFGVNWQLMLDVKGEMEQKICPLLFFTGNSKGRAKEAVNYYTSLFKESEIEGIQYYGEEEASTKGMVKHAQFKLCGQTFMAMDGGEENNHPFNEAVSLVVHCDSQEAVDYYWDHLSEGGEEQAQQCGWLKDKFGVSWQVIPRELNKILGTGNSTRTEQVTRELLKMKKLDINKLREAYG